jgi:hypothetical protein
MVHQVRRVLVVVVALPMMALMATNTAGAAPGDTPTPTTPPAPTGVSAGGRFVAGPPLQFVIRWKGVAAAGASYEVERSQTNDRAIRNYRLVAIVAEADGKPDNTYEFFDPDFIQSGPFVVCYRVQAIVDRIPGPYSQEACPLTERAPSAGPVFYASASPTPLAPMAGTGRSPSGNLTVILLAVFGVTSLGLMGYTLRLIWMYR